MAITAERLREVLDYNPETGLFLWKMAFCRKVRVGASAGCSYGGYKHISVDKRLYRAHRLAWLYVHGEWPAGDIDHINGNRSDNRIANLRDVSRRVNLQNIRDPKPSNKSGLLGASKNGKFWAAVIRTNGKRLFVGNFPTPEQAHHAYVEAKRRMHEGCTI